MYMKNISKSLLAGICIAIGGMIFISVPDKTIGSFLFSIGLFSVLIFKLNLYTGIVCKPKIYTNNLSLIPISFFGNILGASCVGILLSNSEMIITAKELCQIKLNESTVEWWLGSIVCGMFIALAVYGWNSREDIHSHIMVVLGVMGFILTSSEHVVADAFYFSAGGELFNINALMKLFECGIGNMLGGLFMGEMLIVSQEDDI